jgi:hypothetical protein
MRAITILLLSLMLLYPLNVAADETDEDEEDLAAAVEEILSRPVDDADYAESQHCIPRRTVRSIDILDDRRIAFIMRDRSVWLNQTHGTCAGLHPRHALEIKSMGARICRMDIFHGIERTAIGPLGAMHHTSACVLGSFERISEEQLALLKEALGDGPPRRAQRR